MKDYDVPYIDMYNFTNNLGEDIYFDHVHYKEEVRKLQAAFIAGHLNCTFYKQTTWKGEILIFKGASPQPPFCYIILIIVDKKS